MMKPMYVYDEDYAALVKERDEARDRIATLEADLREILRINNCSPEQPWCDDPSYSNDDHYCGHWQEINRVAREALEVDDEPT